NSTFRRFRRWVQKGLFDRSVRVLSDEFDLSVVSIDGTILQAHAKASGSEKGAPAKVSDAQGAV
ncbi:MAG: IS5/IS1182 family transposase, partial [Aestuariivita sp.]|nr:IS5/IS1182 family transposase [Aestuariivita sp.]